jgi:PBP1b-binding outer membrane lipoprotein LpoB
MTKTKTFVLIMAILVAGCAHHPSSERANRAKAEANEIYPIVGISFIEIESLLRDIKEHIPPNAAILSISVAKRSNVVQVVTGIIEGSRSGSGVTFVFEKTAGRWKLVTKSAWIS